MSRAASLFLLLLLSVFPVLGADLPFAHGFFAHRFFAVEARESGSVYPYAVAPSPWEEGWGNHRAVLYVEAPTPAVVLDLVWRRPDAEPEARHLVVREARTGEAVPNLLRLEVGRERCLLVFGPVKNPGEYHFYYMPYKVQAGHGFYHGDYLPPEKAPSKAWAQALPAQPTACLPRAKVLRLESRTAFDSFYPMEVAATAQEVDRYVQAQAADLPFFVFPEDRSRPIRMKAQLPLHWVAPVLGQEASRGAAPQGAAFYGEAAPHEYYAFQVGLWSPGGDVKGLSYRFGGLRCGDHFLPSEVLTCFNIEGVNPQGRPFQKDLDLPQGRVQALWFGVDLPENTARGLYTGDLVLCDAAGRSRTLPLRLKVSGAPLPNRGDNEPWRHSRLRWLNSTLGLSDAPIAPYTPLEVEGTTVRCLGREVVFDSATGFPAQVTAHFPSAAAPSMPGPETPVLQAPLRWVVETASGEARWVVADRQTEQKDGVATAAWTARAGDLALQASRRMEFDGWMEYRLSLTASRTTDLRDVRLVLPFRPETATYFLGAGLPGQETPSLFEGGWDNPEKTAPKLEVSVPTDRKMSWLWPFDSFWVGNAAAGLHCELRGASYTGPLLNAYRPAYPVSWYNGGRGGFRVEKGPEAVNVTCYSGPRSLREGDTLTFAFALLPTPVKPLDFPRQFSQRYYHNGRKPVPTEADVEAGVRVINVHHANEYNPFINYPFLTGDKLKAFVRTWHDQGCQVKLYYTLRELTSAFPELWAIRSLGTEILRGGRGGGYPWCREHLGGDYTPQWYSHFDRPEDGGGTNIPADAALLTTESDSRWYNYYVEGLRWLVQELDIDGLYLDDVSYDRRILQRMRRAMDSVKPGCVIDLHSNTGFSKGPANQYAEFFPYIDKVWFGESFLYDQMSPANWLVESSGIPFGLTGDMLYRGGNKWLGMQYGMTVRHPWLTEGVVCDPRLVWKVWDAFGIDRARVSGFWEPAPAVRTSHPQVKATTYIREGRSLISVGNYTDHVQSVRLQIDWAQLGLNPARVRLLAPQIPDFQEAGEWAPDAPLCIPPRQGLLLYVDLR